MGYSRDRGSMNILATTGLRSLRSIFLTSFPFLPLPRYYHYYQGTKYLRRISPQAAARRSISKLYLFIFTEKLGLKPLLTLISGF